MDDFQRRFPRTVAMVESRIAEQEEKQKQALKCRGLSNELQALKRPDNYQKLSPREQWEIDRELGILDW